MLFAGARVGMEICVPTGNGNKTPNGFWEYSIGLPEYYDGTYQYLKSIVKNLFRNNRVTKAKSYDTISKHTVLTLEIATLLLCRSSA